MAVDLLEYFARTRTDRIGDHVEIYCEVDYPGHKDISYNIHSFGGRMIGPYSEEKSLWENTAGVDAFFEFKTYGLIEYPDEFKDNKCELNVNGLGSAERFSLNQKGSIGVGSFERDKRFQFVLSIYLSLDATMGLLQQMKRQRSDQQTRFKIRFHLIDLAQRGEIVSYSICRAYC